VALSFDGDLTFSVEGPGGATAGTVSGAGPVLRVHAEDPVAAWDGVLGSVSTGPAVLSSVADLLHGEGAVVEVTGPAGLVATVGAGVDSPLGRLLTGSRHVRVGRPAAVRPLAVAQLRRTGRSAARPAGLAAAALALVWLVRRTRR
jgi:hypothetical protein